jgi:3-phenylpropionate/trans-cinnamate dioxygenase beta subunit
MSLSQIEHHPDRRTGRGRVSAELQHEVEQFLYHEAHLLDTGRLREWLDLIGPDITYQVRTRPTVEEHNQHLEPPALAFDDDHQSLTWRVKRAETGMAWAEEPASRTRYLLTNVRITYQPDNDDLVVDCNFLRYRNRLENTEHFLIGTRRDTLRPTPDSYLLTHRLVTLDQNVITSNNLSMLF